MDAADLTGQAFMSDDQQKPATGVTVSVTWQGNPSPKQTLTGSNGAYKVQIPDSLPGPITVTYSKIGYLIYIAYPPPLANTSSQKLAPVFVQPDTGKLSSFDNVGTIAGILKKRAEAVDEGLKAVQFKEDIQALRDSGLNTTVVKKAESQVAAEMEIKGLFK